MRARPDLGERSRPARGRIRGLFCAVILGAAAASGTGQDLQVTEFQALNSTGLRDDDGEASPWIELWNPSPITKINLLNWKLSNGGFEWTFPAVEVMPDGRLLVWSSGKNRVAPTAPLHTHFVLSSGVSSITLVRPDGSIASQFQDYPAQQLNVSYGRDAAQPSLVGFYSSPTPEDPNNYTGTGVAKKVVFSVASRTFTAPFSLSLAQANPEAGAVIRYTTNGSPPTTASPLYATPILVSQTQVVRARVFKDGLLPGETESQGYLLLDASAAAFSSAIPLVVITSFNAPIPAGPKIPGYLWLFEPVAGGRARLTNPPNLATRVAIDKRGSTTLNDLKFSLNVEARRARDEKDTDIALLGMPAHADWVLHAPYRFDPALVRNPFAYGLSNSIGRYAARTKMAEVFLDTDGGSLVFQSPSRGKKRGPSPPPTNYFGVYNVMERIRRAKTRVNITKLNTYENDPVNRTGGYLVKIDRRDAGEIGFHTPHVSYLCYYRPKEEELVSPQRSPQDLYLRDYLTGLDDACFSRPFSDETNGYRAYLDVPAAIDHHLLNTWMFNVDGLRLSTYLHKDRNGKLIYGPVWDFDRALCSADGRDLDPATWRSKYGDKGTDFFNHSWWNRLFTDPDFFQQYIDRWFDLRRGPFSQASVNALIDSLNSAIGVEAVNRDLARWNRPKRSWKSPLTGITFNAGQTAEVQRMKDWLQQRATFINSQFIGPITVSPAAGPIAAGTVVTMTGPTGGTIYYTADGTDPRPAGGGPPVQALPYHGPLIVDPPVTLRARAYNPNWFALSGPDNPPLVSNWGPPATAVFSTPNDSATEAEESALYD